MATDNHSSKSITVQTTSHHTILINAVDSDLAQQKWHICVGYARCGIYNSDTQRTTGRLMHRIILERILNRELLDTEFVDHINGDRLDNRRENLRLATKIENGRNSKQREDNQSGFKGVSRYRVGFDKWRARIRVDKKEIHLGVFETKEDAYQAYREAAIKYFGEFARID